MAQRDRALITLKRIIKLEKKDKRKTCLHNTLVRLDQSETKYVCKECDQPFRVEKKKWFKND